MLGTFDTLFDDDVPMGFFGGYRPQYQSVLAKIGGNASSPDPVTRVTDSATAPGANDRGAAPSVLSYPNGAPVMDINTTNAETEYGLSKERLLSIRQGYDDYKTGRWAQSPRPVPNLP